MQRLLFFSILVVIGLLPTATLAQPSGGTVHCDSLCQKLVYHKERFKPDSLHLVLEELASRTDCMRQRAVYFNFVLYKGYLYNIETNFDSASVYAHEALQLARKHGLPADITTAAILMAELYYRQNRTSDAVGLLTPRLEHALARKDMLRAAQLHNILSRTYLAGTSPDAGDSAFYHYQQAKQLSLAVADSMEYHKALYVGAYCYLDRGNFEQSLQLVRQCVRFFTANGYNRASILCRLLQARNLTLLHRNQMARSTLDSCLAFGKAVSDYDMIRIAYNALAELEEQTGNYKGAVAVLREYQAYSDTLNSAQNKLALATAGLTYEKQLKEKENQLLAAEVSNKKSALNRFRNGTIAGGLMLMVAGLGYFLYTRNRQRQQKARQKQLETEAQLRHLRAQLNPHFLQNLFNAVYLQMVQGQDTDTVKNFIHEIAYFFRSVLVLNERDNHSLEEEIKFANSYLALQQKICAGRITWQTQLAEEVDAENHQVPAMILQPLLENCIRHGFVNGSRNGHIQLGFYYDGMNNLVCKIGDNGIGAKAKEQKQLTQTHTSVGIENCAQRLLVGRPGKVGHDAIQFAYTDGGTTVTIYF
jgi:hypothetical protein